MLKVVWSSLLVALLGVIAPLAGVDDGPLLLPNETWHVHLFPGRDVMRHKRGNTARVLRDLERVKTPVAKIVLGAAVIDDCAGIGRPGDSQAIIVQGSASFLEVTWLAGKAFGFLIAALIIGDWLSPRLFHIASVLRVHGMMMVTGLVICFGLSWAASLIGLARL